MEALPEDVLVYAIEGPFFFGSVGLAAACPVVVAHRTKPCRAAARARALHGRHRPEAPRIDDRGLRARGIQVLLSGANLAVLRKLVRADIIRRDDPASYFKDLASALRHAQAARTSDKASQDE